MIYFAQRASNIYSEQLSNLRKLGQPFNIFSVIGGLSFVHALNASTRSLTLIDPDIDTHLYCRMILELLRKSESGQEFFELLTNHEVSREWWSPGGFLEAKNLRLKAKQYLADSALVELYDATYGSMRFDPKSATGWIGESTIKFYGDDLKPMTFCWKIGSGAFSSDANFSELRTGLSRISPRYIEGRFEELDFESLLHNLEGDTVILASNTESPLFSQSDNIFLSIERKVSSPVRYISWHRNTVILPREQVIAQGIRDLSLALSNQSCFSVAGLSKGEGVDVLPAESIVFKNLEDLRGRIHYGWGTFFINCCDLSESEKVTKFSETLEAIMPCFTSIIFWGKGSLKPLIQAIETVGMQRSYEVSSLKWYADYYLASWQVKGCVDALKV